MPGPSKSASAIDDESNAVPDREDQDASARAVERREQKSSAAK